MGIEKFSPAFMTNRKGRAKRDLRQRVVTLGIDQRNLSPAEGADHRLGQFQMAEEFCRPEFGKPRAEAANGERGRI